jgi:hypothetical protein
MYVQKAFDKGGILTGQKAFLFGCTERKYLKDMLSRALQSTHSSLSLSRFNDCIVLRTTDLKDHPLNVKGPSLIVFKNRPTKYFTLITNDGLCLTANNPIHSICLKAGLWNV